MPGRQKMLNPFVLRASSRYDDIERLDDARTESQAPVDPGTAPSQREAADSSATASDIDTAPR